MNKKIYIVTSVDYGGYDSYDISYHLSRKGALKYIMNCKYADWLTYRYIVPGGYEDSCLYISERDLHE